MQDIDKLQIIRDRQFQCLRNIVEEGIRIGWVGKNDPLYQLFLKSEKEHDGILNKILNTK